MQDRPIRLVCARREGGLEVPGPAPWPIASIAGPCVIDLLSAGNGLGIGPHAEEEPHLDRGDRRSGRGDGVNDSHGPAA